MGGLGDEQALLAKARSKDVVIPKDVIERLNTNSNKTVGDGEDGSSSKRPSSWQEAARSVKISPRSTYPKIHEFELSLLPSIRTIHAQFSIALCPYCKRPMLESVLGEHVANCKFKNAKQKGAHSTAAASAAAAAETASEPSGLRKKRKLGDENGTGVKAEEDSSSQKKAKWAAKAKTAKTTGSSAKQTTTKTRAPKQSKQSKQAKGPAAVYNPDKNCGVLLPNGQPCMRSLTCKQHSMGAKRAVPGRSAPYDVLLSNYHKQHQMKQAQLTANAAQAAQLESDHLQEAETQQSPESEVQQVWEGITRALRSPLSMGRVVSSPARANSFRMREMLAVALLPRRLPPTGDILYGRSLTFQQDSPEKLEYVRSQAVQQAIYLSQMHQRQSQLRRQQSEQQIGRPNSQPMRNSILNQQRAQGSMPQSIPQIQQEPIQQPVRKGLQQGQQGQQGQQLPQQQQQQQMNARLLAQQQLQKARAKQLQNESIGRQQPPPGS